MSDKNAQVTAIAPVKSTEEANRSLAHAELQVTRDNENVTIIVAQSEEILTREVKQIESELLPQLEKKITAAFEHKQKELAKREKAVEVDIRKDSAIVAFLAAGAKINVFMELTIAGIQISDKGDQIQVGTRYTQPGYGNGVSPISKSCFNGKKDEDEDEKSKARFRFFPLGKELEKSVAQCNKLVKIKSDVQSLLLEKRVALGNMNQLERRAKMKLLTAHRSQEELAALEAIIQGERGDSDDKFNAMVSSIKNLG